MSKWMEIYWWLKREYKNLATIIYRNRDWFNNLWTNGGDEDEWYEFARFITTEAWGEPIEYVLFDKGWQYRTVLHPLKREAIKEFINALLGWY